MTASQSSIRWRLAPGAVLSIEGSAELKASAIVETHKDYIVVDQLNNGGQNRVYFEGRSFYVEVKVGDRLRVLVYVPAKRARLLFTMEGYTVLDYFTGAAKLGMTATPMRQDNRDTYLYFGNPIYTYSLRQGIDDGFLAFRDGRRLPVSCLISPLTSPPSAIRTMRTFTSSTVGSISNTTSRHGSR